MPKAKPIVPSSPRPAEPQLKQKALGSYRIPPALTDEVPERFRGDLYIMIVGGDCLDPVARHGDCVIAAPGMAIRAGDLVVMWPADTAQRPSTKRVVLAPPEGWATWRSDDCVPAIIIEQLNPPRVYSVRTDQLAAIHRVVATFRPDEYEQRPIRPRASRRRATGAAA